MILIRVPFLWVTGMALFPFVLIRSKRPSKTLINHEKIHLKQQLELAIVFFYIWYILEFFYLRIFVYKTNYKAYKNICFEKEAYQNEDDLNYLMNRKFWNFWRYLK